MTPASEPHRLRCETCENKICEFHPKQKSISYMGSPISDIVHDFTSNHGCASHTSAPAAQDRIDAVIRELERRKKLYAIPGLDFSVGKVEGFDEAIALLQAGGRK